MDNSEKNKYVEFWSSLNLGAMYMHEMNFHEMEQAATTFGFIF